MAEMDASRSSTIRRFKSGEDNQGIQLKRMLIKGPVPKPYKIVPHPFRLTFRKRTMVRLLLLFISPLPQFP